MVKENRKTSPISPDLSELKANLPILQFNEIELALRLNEKLDRALEATFPASDALSSLDVVQPHRGWRVDRFSCVVGDSVVPVAAALAGY